MALTTFLTPLLLILLPAETESISDAELLARAEAAFRSGVAERDYVEKARPLFRTAATAYDALRQRGAQSADLCRNQGNASLLAGDLPQAILCYRRGLRFAPADRKLRQSLAYVREQIAYPPNEALCRPPVDSRPPWLPYLSPRWALLLFAGCYSLGCLSLVRWWMVGRAALLGVTIPAFVLAAVLGSSLLWEACSERESSQHALVVVAVDGLPLRKGNGVLYPRRLEAPLHRGVEAKLRFERGSWLQIELAGGAIGWVPRSAVLLDSP